MSSRRSAKPHPHRGNHARQRQKNEQRAPSPTLICCEILPGLRPFAEQELRERFGKQITLFPDELHKALFISYTGKLAGLFSLKTVVAVYRVDYFAVSRPRALLGHQHYHALLDSIQAVCALHPGRAFTSIRVSAAGDHSSVFLTLKEQLAQDTGLRVDDEDADLLMRVRPASLAPTGWEVLIRLTPRPLSARLWRVFNMKGALNGTIAAAIVRLSKPRGEDRFLNLMCGSGTLLIERLQQGAAAVAIGCDLSAEALAGARLNLEQAHLTEQVQLHQVDATQLPFANQSFNRICADVPWGNKVGSHEENQQLYPRLLQEAARVAMPDALLLLMTHEIMLFETLLPTCAALWGLQEVIKVEQGGLNPRIYVFRRNELA